MSLAALLGLGPALLGCAVGYPAAVAPVPVTGAFAGETYALESYGVWREVPSYGPVWCPAVAPGWQPYYYNDPWGFTYHSGSWIQASFGWAWVPSTAHRHHYHRYKHHYGYGRGHHGYGHRRDYKPRYGHGGSHDRRYDDRWRGGHPGRYDRRDGGRDDGGRYDRRHGDRDDRGRPDLGDRGRGNRRPDGRDERGRPGTARPGNAQPPVRGGDAWRATLPGRRDADRGTSPGRGPGSVGSGFQRRESVPLQGRAGRRAPARMPSAAGPGQWRSAPVRSAPRGRDRGAVAPSRAGVRGSGRGGPSESSAGPARGQGRPAATRGGGRGSGGQGFGSIGRSSMPAGRGR